MEYKVKVLYHFVHFYTFRCSNELACHCHKRFFKGAGGSDISVIVMLRGLKRQGDFLQIWALHGVPIMAAKRAHPPGHMSEPRLMTVFLRCP